MLSFFNRLLTCMLVLAAAGALDADEGMWLYERFPKADVQRKYGFEVSDSFLDHLRLSSVRFNNGGSGSFISSEGLLFTNHHVGSDCIFKLSTSEHDYLKDGYYAPRLEDERACPDLEVNVLLKIEDVTSKITAGITDRTPASDANQIRKANMSAIEKACNESTGNRCDVVTLFSGMQYHLYQYKKYTDVRLVFAPETEVGAFGGDPDNFTYPRYCLDFALFRAYENGKPAQVDNYLRWSREGVKDGELVFVSGNPGATGRLATVAELEFSRDTSYPLVLRLLRSRIEKLSALTEANAESKRIAGDTLFGDQNSFKAYTGFMSGLKDPALIDQKQKEERALRQAVNRDPEEREKFGKIWDDVQTAYGEYAKFYKRYYMLERFATRDSALMDIARDVLRYSEEGQKPNGERLRQFVDTALPALEMSMYTEAPIYDELEIAVLSDYLASLQRELGASDPVVKAALNGKTSEQAAEHYVKTSKLKDISERKRLAKDAEAVKSSKDGMIVLARLLDGPARAELKRYEDKIEAVITSSASKISQAQFKATGGRTYPDATFTLRLTYGAVKGYNNEAGQAVPWATTMGGMYQRVRDTEPYTLPKRWIEKRDALNLSTPYNFVSTVDTHGGNSGSPTVNTKGELVGILFDGNLEGLPNRFVFRDKMERSVHVAGQAIIESLSDMYGADRILNELDMEQ